LISVATALDGLKLLDDVKVLSTPVVIGGGTTTVSHGRLSVPTPATLEILKSKNFPIVGGPVEAELTTPLGAAMLTSLADRAVRFYPALLASAVGYGAGKEDFGGFPNVLRVIVGQELT
jgi:hypothetical protein